jgi:hypothetical protein
MPKITEGTAPFKEHHTWFRRAGSPEPGKIPLLALHGGPGATHSCMKSLDDLPQTDGRLFTMKSPFPPCWSPACRTK